MKLVRQFIASVLLLVFAASNTALLPAALTAVSWLDHDHAVSLVASDGRLEIVLSHHDEKTDAAVLLADSQRDHRHGWAAGVLVSLAESPAPAGDHVIPFTLSGQALTEHASATLPVAPMTAAPCPPTTQFVTLTALPAISPTVAARPPPPVSQLLLSLRTTVLVV